MGVDGLSYAHRPLIFSVATTPGTCLQALPRNRCIHANVYLFESVGESVFMTSATLTDRCSSRAPRCKEHAYKGASAGVHMCSYA